MSRLVEVWSPERTVPLAAILGPLRRGAGDPTMVVQRNDIWWAARTPVGVTATWWHVDTPPVAGDAPRRSRVTLRAWGPGAQWFGGRVAVVLGDGDDPGGMPELPGRLGQALRWPRHADWRVPRTGLVMASLVPSILEQKVTGQQAFAGYRHLVRRFGQPVAFPPEALAAAGRDAQRVARLMAPPDTGGWRRIPSWEWLRAGVEPAQSRTVVRVAEIAARLEETAAMTDLAAAHRRLRSVPGIGVWTVAKVAQTAWGDADAPTFGDYHVAKNIGQALLGRDIDDTQMARLLEPYRGHRFRAERMILAVAGHRERRGPRMAVPAHLPARWQPA